MSLSTKVLNRPPSYRGLLESTRWDNDSDLVTRDWKQRNYGKLIPEFSKLDVAYGNKLFHMFGSLHVRVFDPIKDFHPEEVRLLSIQLAEKFDGEWNDECRCAMAQIARIWDYGLASLRVVTTVGVNYLTDAWQGIGGGLTQMRYHGIGSGTNAESTGDTALQTEFTTQLTPASTRATGTQTEGASANIYRTVGSNVVNSSVTAAEHGIFSNATVAVASPTNVLWDRSQFAGVGLVNGNTFQTTYDLTTAAGG